MLELPSISEVGIDAEYRRISESYEELKSSGITYPSFFAVYEVLNARTKNDRKWNKSLY